MLITDIAGWLWTQTILGVTPDVALPAQLRERVMLASLGQNIGDPRERGGCFDNMWYDEKGRGGRGGCCLSSYQIDSRPYILSVMREQGRGCPDSCAMGFICASSAVRLIRCRVCRKLFIAIVGGAAPLFFEIVPEECVNAELWSRSTACMKCGAGKRWGWGASRWCYQIQGEEEGEEERE
jgi:hypothetical protein